jgi:uncharacterized membrane protein
MTAAHPQIMFKNSHNEQVYVAVCRYVSAEKYWLTTGWFTIGKGGERLVLDKILPGDSVGYWAMTTITEEKFEGNKELVVNDDTKFTIRYADKQETADKNPNNSWKKFVLLRLPPGATRGTINLK